MIRLAIVVEGETEEEFVKLVLAEHLRGGGGNRYPSCLAGGEATSASPGSCPQWRNCFGTMTS